MPDDHAFVLREALMSPLWRCERQCARTAAADAPLCSAMCVAAQTLVTSMHAYSPALAAVHSRMGNANYVEVPDLFAGDPVQRDDEARRINW